MLGGINRLVAFVVAIVAFILGVAGLVMEDGSKFIGLFRVTEDLGWTYLLIAFVLLLAVLAGESASRLFNAVIGFGVFAVAMLAGFRVSGADELNNWLFLVFALAMILASMFGVGDRVVLRRRVDE